MSITKGVPAGASGRHALSTEQTTDRAYRKTMKIKKLCWLITMTLLALSGCEFVDDPDVPMEKPLQTSILEVRVEPDPVVVGDTARFTCIIEDSLDTRFRFFWFIGGPGGGIRSTTTNYFDWVAPEVSDTTTFTHGVEVDNGSPDSASVSKSFKVTVVTRE